MKKFISIDIGTTHCKAIAMQVDGRVVYERKMVYSFDDMTKAQTEQDVVKIYEAVMELLHDAKKACEKDEVAAVTFSSAMHGVVAVDENNLPLTPLYTWAHNESLLQAEKLLSGNEAGFLSLTTGTPIHPMSPLCKIMWLREQRPEIFDKSSKFISAKEFIFYKLFGKYLIDHSLASATGMFDIVQKKWNNKAIQIAGITEDRLSLPADPLHSETSDIMPGVPFVIGASDGCLANLGGGVMSDGQASLTIGTSGAIRITTTRPVLGDARLFNYILSDPYFVCGGAVNNGGNVVKWFMENFCGKKFNSTEDLDWLTSMASHVKAGSEGLIFLPYVFGERAPVWDARARGAFVGLNANHNIDHMARAVFEGLFMALKDILHAIEANGVHVKEIHASGAFVNSDFLMKLMANVLNKAVIISEHSDASAIGACYLGMKAIGISDALEEIGGLNRETKEFVPEGDMASVYNKAYNVYKAIYPALKPIGIDRLGESKT